MVTRFLLVILLWKVFKWSYEKTSLTVWLRSSKEIGKVWLYLCSAGWKPSDIEKGDTNPPDFERS